MTQRKMYRIAALLLAAFIAVVAAAGQDAKALAGKWNMVSETEDEPIKWTLVLKETDGKLTALLATDGGEEAAKDFSYADGVLKFKAPYQGNYYDIELKAVGDTLAGTWSGDGNSGKTSGTKS